MGWQMQRIQALLAVIGLSLLLSSCGDDDRDAVRSAAKPFTIADLVDFDTAVYYAVTSTRPASSIDLSEPVVYCEQSLGEPFTDVDGDGIYNPDVDQFVTSADPAINQDLNYNWRHDGPYDPWTPGIPFDDLDDDGEYDWRDDHHGLYAPGRPFIDYNQNGVWDSTCSVCLNVYRFSRSWSSEGDPFGTVSLVQPAEGNFSFVSDSGWTYAHGATPVPNAVFRLDSAGLWYLGHREAVLHIMHRGDILPVSEEHERLYSGVNQVRSVIFGASLTIRDQEYRGLIQVEIADIYHYAHAFIDSTYHSLGSADLFFPPRQLHFLAVRHGWPDGSEEWLYFDQRPDTVPLPMARYRAPACSHR